MPIHRLLMRLFSAFCERKALNGNVKRFVFDLACDVTGTPGSNFSTSSERSRPGLFVAVWIFLPRLLVTEIDGLRPPPPPAEGRGRTRSGRAQVKNSHIRMDCKLFRRECTWNSVYLCTGHFGVLAHVVKCFGIGRNAKQFRLTSYKFGNVFMIFSFNY